MAEGNFNIILEKPQVLAGRLLDDSGRGLPNITITAVAVTSSPQKLSQKAISAPRQWLTEQTNEQGNFVFKYFAADVTLNFIVKIPGRQITYKFTPFPSTACGYEVGRKDIRLTVPSGASVEGRIIDRATNKGVANISLELNSDYHANNKYFYFPVQVTSDADGKFTINDVPPGKHNLELLTKEDQTCEWISKIKAVEIKPLETQKEISFVVEKGGFIEATVFDDLTKRPLPGAPVVVFNQNYSDGRRNYAFRRTVITNEDGIARIACRQESARWRPGKKIPIHKAILQQ